LITVLTATVTFAIAWAFLALSPIHAGTSPSKAPCSIAVLRGGGDDISVGFVPLSEGEESLLPEDVITFILPYGTGQSGDLIQASAPPGRFYAGCVDGELRTTIKKQDGTSRALPPLETAGLSSYRIRVNVIRGDGLRRAFLIDNYNSVAPDTGPVIDMFQGQIPLADGDVSITLEISKHAAHASAEGSVTGDYYEGLAFVDVTNSDGETGSFVVDFGSATTLVAKDFLPEGSSISEVYGVEHSGEGSRRVEGWIGGAGGEVTNFLGSSEIGPLRAGGITFDDVGVMVVEEIPELGGKRTAGIIGLDLLYRAEAVSIKYSGEETLLRMGPLEELLGGEAENDAPWVPFTKVSEHILIEGTVDGVPASFVLDSGARGSFLASDVAVRAKLEPVPDMKREFRGLDENSFEATGVRAREVVAGGRAFGEVSFYKADMAAFGGMGITEGGALLGNDFIARHGGLTVDFERGRLLFGR
jgi:hypothetical protein